MPIGIEVPACACAERYQSDRNRQRRMNPAENTVIGSGVWANNMLLGVSDDELSYYHAGDRCVTIGSKAVNSTGSRTDTRKELRC